MAEIDKLEKDGNNPPEKEKWPKLAISDKEIEALYNQAQEYQDKLKDLYNSEVRINDWNKNNLIVLGAEVDIYNEVDELIEAGTNINTHKAKVTDIQRTVTWKTYKQELQDILPIKKINKYELELDNSYSFAREYNPEDKPGSGTYKYSPEEIYVEHERRKLLKKVWAEVKPLLTRTQKKLMPWLLKMTKPKCSLKCPNNEGKDHKGILDCEHFNEYDCRMIYYKPSRYLYNAEIERELGYKKSAVTKLLSKMPEMMKKKYQLHSEDMDFLFR